MYPLQIHAASKNIHVITVAGCHCSFFWKYKLVLSSSEIWDWKLGTNIIRTKEKLSKVWDLWSDGEGEKEKKEEISAASPKKGRNTQAHHPTCEGGRWGENFERWFCQAGALQISSSPSSKTSTASQGCHQGLPSIPLVSHGDHGDWGCPQDHAGAAEFQQESSASRAAGTPKQRGGCRKELPFPSRCISSHFNFAQHNSSAVRHSLAPSTVCIKQK